MSKEEAKKENQEKNILNSEEYKKIIENTSDLIALVSFSINPAYLYISPSHKSILGYSSEDLVGKPSFEFLHPDDKKKLFPLLKQYISTKAKKLLIGEDLENSERIKYRFKDKKGNWHNLESTVDFLGNKLLFISRDVTKHKQIEKEIQKRNIELEKTNKLMIGREIKMMELKKRIKELESKMKIT